MCAAPAHEIVCMPAMYKTRGSVARVGVFLSARAVSFRGSRSPRTSGCAAAGCVPRAAGAGVAVRGAAAVVLPLAVVVHPAGRRVVRGPWAPPPAWLWPGARPGPGH